MPAFLHAILSAAGARPLTTLDDLLAAIRAEPAERSPFELACTLAARSDRIAFAFVAGYAAALRALAPSLDPSRARALCATEAGGAHPRAIQATLARDGDVGLRLRGEKTFVTLGDRAEELLVVASTGADHEGKNLLAVARVDARAHGVSLHPLGPTPFCPEVGHARVVFDDVAVADEDVLAGDGYTRLLKPFRTIEDVHVHAALVAHYAALVRAAGDRDETRAVVARGASLLAALATIAGADPLAPATHVALGGAIAEGARFLADAEPHLAALPDEVRMRLRRDAPILGVAKKAREQRLASGWSALAATTRST